MDYQEEQAHELEALESIFESDFARTELGCEITLKPVANGKAKHNHKIALLSIEYSKEYPNTPLSKAVVSDVLGLDSGHIEKLNAIVQTEIEQTPRGEIMVFNLTEALKEYLIENNIKEASLHDRIQERMDKEEAERKEKERLEAEAKEKEDEDESDDDGFDVDNVSTIADLIPNNMDCTDENFEWWSKLFLEEQAKRRAEELARRGQSDKTLSMPTGRQIFINNLIAGLDDDLAADSTGAGSNNTGGDADEVVEGEAGEEDKKDEVFWFNETIFEGEDLFGLDDEDGDDFFPDDDDDDNGDGDDKADVNGNGNEADSAESKADNGTLENASSGIAGLKISAKSLSENEKGKENEKEKEKEKGKSKDKEKKDKKDKKAKKPETPQLSLSSPIPTLGSALAAFGESGDEGSGSDDDDMYSFGISKEQAAQLKIQKDVPKSKSKDKKDKKDDKKEDKKKDKKDKK